MNNARRCRHLFASNPWSSLVALAVLLVLALGCVESGMLFTPDGKDLILTTTAPYPTEEMLHRGEHLYRLVRFNDLREMKTVEESVTHMLSGPAAAPDGKHYAYLRVDLPTEPPTKRDRPSPKPGKPQTASLRQFQFGGPELGLPYELLQAFEQNKPLSAELVFRSYQDDSVFKRVAVPLPWSGEDNGLLYALARPQFTTDGSAVYLATGEVVLRVNLDNPSSPELLPFHEMTGELSPDGKTLALANSQRLVFMSIDGDRMTLLSEVDELAPLSVKWIANDTVVALCEHTNKLHLRMYMSDGAMLKSVLLKEIAQTDADGMAYASVSPDGRRIVFCNGSTLYVLDRDGAVLSTFQTETPSILSAPVFSPSGKYIAVKYAERRERTEDDAQPEIAPVSAILFLNDSGQERWRVQIPPSPKTPSTEGTPLAETPAEDHATLPKPPLPSTDTRDASEPEAVVTVGPAKPEPAPAKPDVVDPAPAETPTEPSAPDASVEPTTQQTPVEAPTPDAPETAPQEDAVATSETVDTTAVPDSADPPKKAQPLFKLPDDKTMLVFAEAPLEDQFMRALLTDLTKRLNTTLLLSGTSPAVIEPESLHEAKQEEGFSKLTISEVGEKLGSQVVMYIRVQDYDARQERPFGGWTGKFETTVRVVDVTEGRLWPDTKGAGWPVKVSIDYEDAEKSVEMADRLSAEMAKEIARLFVAADNLPAKD